MFGVAGGVAQVAKPSDIPASQEEEDNRGVIVLVGDLDDVVLREVGIAETTLGA